MPPAALSVSRFANLQYPKGTLSLISNLQSPISTRSVQAPIYRHLLILLLLLTAFFLRTYQLNHQALRGDEAATVLYSALPIADLWELSRVTDPHPPLYYLMLHPWQWLVGESAWAMRFAGVVASVLAVAALYALAHRTLHAAGVSLLAAGLLAVNPFQIWLAQDVRSYPFFTLLGLLSSGALWLAVSSQQLAVSDSPPPRRHPSQRYTGGEPGRVNTTHHPLPTTHYPLRTTHYALRITPWLVYVFFTVICFYVHYYTVFLIAFQGLFVLLNIQRFWDRKWPWLVSQIAIGLLIIPGLQLAYNFLGQAAGGIEIIPASDILRLASTTLLSGVTIDASRGLWASLLLAPLWITGTLALLRRNVTTGTFWTLFFATPVLGVLALSLNRPFFKERFLVQAQPAFALLLATGIVTLWRIHRVNMSRTNTQSPIPNTPYASRFALYVSRITHHASRITVILLLATLLYFNLIALGNYFANPAYAKAPPWYLYHDYVSKEARPGDVVLTNFPEAAVSYYSPNDLPFYVVPAERDRSVEFRLEQTEQIANAYDRIWFLPLLRQGFDEQGDVLNWLDRHADRVNQVFFPLYHLNLYLSPASIETTMISRPVTFAHGLRLRGYQILDETGRSRLSPLPPVDAESDAAYLLTVEPQDEFTLSLYWLADGPTAEPYTVFTHLVAADGFNRTGQDNQPVWGTYPTTGWRPGEKVTDRYTLTVPEGAPPGDHHLHVGWYRSATQERVPILDDAGRPVADQVVLTVIIRVQ